MIAYLLIIAAAVTRLVPHASNVAAITAVAIFSGAILPKKQAFVIPFAARLITDSIIGFFAWKIMVAVYAAHLVGVLFGMWVKNSSAKKTQWVKILVSSLSSAMLFFLVTNLAFLYSTYPHTWQGIGMAYANGLPFFRATLLGDVAYTFGLFGLYQAAGYLVLHFNRHQNPRFLNQRI